MGTGEVWLSAAVWRLVGLVLIVIGAGTAQVSSSPQYLDPLPQDIGAAALKQQLRRLDSTGRLMMVVAHPDDEDGGLLTLESRGRGVRALLMTLTRGEGGQNKTGGTFSDELGLLRTLELLASDRYYAVEQRFGHVADFGYSKTPEETFQKWGGHDLPLADVVRVIRQFRPDVLIARFSGTGRDGHGHHQASSILTQEAFRAAADPNRFPEQIKEGLQPWQAKKLYIGNVCGFGSNTCPDDDWTVKLNTGEEDPGLGMSYVQFAIEGLRHQQSQGLGDLRIPSGPRYAFYKLADSVLPKSVDSSGHEKDFFEGIDISLAHLAAKLGAQGQIPGLAKELDKIAAQVGDSPDALVDVLDELEASESQVEGAGLNLRIKSPLLQALSEKRDEAAAALNLALNLTLEANIAPPQSAVGSAPAEKEALTPVSPGQSFELTARLHNGSGKRLSIRGASVDHPQWIKRAHAEQATLGPGGDYVASFLVGVPQDAPITRPYWHRDDPQTDSLYKVDERYQTLPLPPPPLRVKIQYQIAGDKRSASMTADVGVLLRDQHGSTRRQRMAITPAFSVALEPGEQALPLSDGNATSANVRVSSNLDSAPAGKLRLDLPAGWRAEPGSFDVTLSKRGDARDFSFKVFPARLAEGKQDIHAVLDVSGKTYKEAYTLVSRDDLGSFYDFQPAVQRISVIDVKLPRDLKVAYIMGAGDDIPTILQQIRMNVTVVAAEKIANEDLSQYGAIVLGVRAYDTHKDLVTNNRKLLDFVSNGGTLIVQNNNSVGDFNTEHLTPYPAELSRARVSVEEAPVTILAPDDPIFHRPNQISQKDFDGWVQERGLYFMDKWDDHFKPLLACHDPTEPDQKGGLLLAKYGKGTYIYTGYAFFRQIPAGVPGAIRLFVNLVSAGRG